MKRVLTARARYRVLETPTGPFFILERTDQTLRSGWLDLNPQVIECAREVPRLLPNLSSRIQRYFDGEAVDFSDIQLPEGAPFHRACWKAARLIPHGGSQSYTELAHSAGRPTAARAAGQAMRRNPLPIIIPCHRVVASGGGLGGFSGTRSADDAALGIKKILLQLEGHSVPSQFVRVPLENLKPVG